MHTHTGIYHSYYYNIIIIIIIHSYHNRVHTIHNSTHTIYCLINTAHSTTKKIKSTHSNDLLLKEYIHTSIQAQSPPPLPISSSAKHISVSFNKSINSIKYPVYNNFGRSFTDSFPLSVSFFPHSTPSFLRGVLLQERPQLLVLTLQLLVSGSELRVLVL